MASLFVERSGLHRQEISTGIYGAALERCQLLNSASKSLRKVRRIPKENFERNLSAGSLLVNAHMPSSKILHFKLFSRCSMITSNSYLPQPWLVTSNTSLRRLRAQLRLSFRFVESRPLIRALILPYSLYLDAFTLRLMVGAPQMSFRRLVNAVYVHEGTMKVVTLDLLQ